VDGGWWNGDVEHIRRHGVGGPNQEVNVGAFSEDRAREIIAKELEVDPKQVTAEAKFIEDLGADSLDIVELVMALEEEFGLDIPDEDADKLKTVGDAMNYLQQHAGK
jgi:acyl carrier protein